VSGYYQGLGKFGYCKSNESGHFGKWCLAVCLSISWRQRLPAHIAGLLLPKPPPVRSGSTNLISFGYVILCLTVFVQLWILSVIFPDVQAYRFQALALFYCCYVSPCVHSHKNFSTLILISSLIPHQLPSYSCLQKVT